MTAVRVTCFTLCLSQLFTRTFCTECSDYNYQLTPLPDFDDLFVNQNLMWENQVLIGLECVSKCFFDHRCHSVQIDRNTGICTGHATAFATPTKIYPPALSREGSRLYLLPRDYQLTLLPDFDDKFVNQNLVWENQVVIGVECVSKCFFDHRCHSVQIDRNTGGCTGHATAFATPTKIYPPALSREGSRLYLLPRAFHYIGSGCTSDGDCHVATSVCNDGVCTCQIGYWFSHSQQACVTECTSLGPGLVRYAGHAIWGNDLEELTSIEDSQCQQLCINITCSSIDYDPPGKRCFLSSATYLSVDSGSRGVHAGWVHYQRNCAS